MKTFKRLALSLTAMIILFACSQTAFAYVDEGKGQKQEGSKAQPAEEDPAEQKKDDSQQEEESKRESEPEKDSGVLTPEGELDLKDDLSGEEAGDLQFMTVQTRDGTVFYLIIDHASNSKNVYFLNQVDASDLLAIMNDEEVDAYEESLKEKEESRPQVIQPQQEEVREPAQEQAESYSDEKKDDTKDEKNERKGSALPLAAVLGVIAAGVLGGYYFFKIRPERNGSKIDRMEFEDDEYIDDGPEEPDE